MSYKITPVTNNHYRSEILRRVRDADDIPVDEDHAVAVNDAHLRLLLMEEPFHEVLATIRQAYHHQRACIELRNESLDALDRDIRDFWEGVERRIVRYKMPRSTLLRYRLPGEFYRPTVRSLQQKLSIAKNMIEGDRLSIQAGIDPMSNPSIEDLEKTVTDTRHMCRASDVATREFNQLRKRFSQVRDQTDRAINNLAGYLRIAFRGQDPVIRRELMRSLGFAFSNDDPSNGPESEPFEIIEELPLTLQEETAAMNHILDPDLDLQEEVVETQPI